MSAQRVGSAQARSASESASPVQSAASLDLAWRVVFAAEQRKAALMEHTRPVAFRSRRLGEKTSLPHDSPDRPNGAHGSRAILPTFGGGGELQVSPHPARPVLRSSRVPQVAQCEGDFQVSGRSAQTAQSEGEDFTREVRTGKEGSSGSRRRAKESQQQSAECGIAVSGQSVLRQRPPTSTTAGWPPEAPRSAESAPERLSGATINAAAFMSSSTQECRSTCSAQEFLEALQVDAAQSEGERTGLQTLDRPLSTQSDQEAVRVAQGHDGQHAPSSAGEVRVLVPASGSADKSGSTAAFASARSTRPRATISTANSKTCTFGSSVAAATSAEPLSPQRPVRRTQSMPARRKGEESCPKPKLGRSSFARRVVDSTELQKCRRSTATAAAGAGAVAVKKKAKASGKLMLPFAYAEDDPRVAHVEAADGRIIPEFLP